MINEFDGEYFFLSNYYPAPVIYCATTFGNNEAAFQAMKCPYRIASFADLPPNEAKRLGRRVHLREDWEEVKDNIMYEICKAKFTQNEDLRQRLLATGDEYLEEGNYWDDKYWGVCGGEGQNKLGKILMRVRDELREEK